MNDRGGVAEPATQEVSLHSILLLSVYLDRPQSPSMSLTSCYQIDFEY
jgi:hypothetical protein